MSVLEDLTEEECYLYSILTDPSGIDQAEFLWQDPENVHGTWRAWPFQWKWFQCLDPLQIEQAARCIAEGSLVLTENGWVEIQDVEVGQKVLTHMGRWRRVEGVHDRGVKKVVRVNGQGPKAGLVVTPDHKFWARKAVRASQPKDGHKGKKLLDPGWLAAEGFEQNDGSGIMHTNWATPAEVEPLPVPPIMLGYASGQQNTISSPVNAAWLWLYGLFIADGSTYIDDQYAKICWAAHVSQVDRVVEAVEALGLNYHLDTSQENCVQVVVNSRPLAKWLRTQAGHGAVNKRLAPWVYGLDADLREQVFQGLLFGDGHVKADGVEQYTTVSTCLSLGVRVLASTLDRSAGECVGRSEGVTTINGKEYATKESYSICMKPLGLQNRPHVQVHGIHAWSPASTVTDVGEAHVWDLTVEEDHSFVVEGIVVHNSVGKSTSIKLRAFAFPFLHPKAEMMIGAPELNHLTPITDLIEQQFLECRLGREMLPRGANKGITHRPFHMSFLNGSRIMGRIPQRDGKGFKGCLVEGSLIWTRDRGLIPVEQLVVGDFVFTDEGRWMPVSKICVDVNDCFEVRGQSSFPMLVSCDHRFLGAENSAGPKAKRAFLPLRFHDVEDLLEENVYWASPNRFPESDPIVPDGFNDCDAFWWAVGRYLADGYRSMDKKRNKSRRVHWVIHPDKTSELTERLDVLDLHYGITERAHSSANVVDVASSSLNAYLLEFFGEHADGKTIPSFALGMREGARQSLLDGYLSGDGHLDKRGRWTAGSASKRLAVGIQLLAQSLGFTVNCHVVQPPANDKCASPKPSYRVQILKGHPVKVNDYFVAKVKSVEPVGKMRVFNPIVEEDHSYLSGSIMSHNMHPLQLELDEAQDVPQAAWVELIETLKRGEEDARWRIHGVTRGVRDYFYKFTQPESDFMVHRITAMMRPTWTSQEREEKIEMYGSRDNPDYRRNVYGLHGDAQSPLFVLARLMQCVDTEPTSDYNERVYTHFKMSDEMIQDIGGDVEGFLQFPGAHLKKGRIFYAGADIGYTNHPTEILVFGRDNDGKDSFKVTLLTRITLERTSHPHQARIFAHLVKEYGLRVFSMDKTGVGLPIFQEMQSEWPVETGKIKGFNFSEKILTGLDDSIKVDPDMEDEIEKAGIKRRVLDYASDVLRDYVDHQRIVLPWDKGLLAEFQGQTYQVVKGALDTTGKKAYSKGSFHALDAAKMAVLGIEQEPIDEMLLAREREREGDTIVDQFISF